MSDHGATMVHDRGGATPRFGLQVFGAALLASAIAGLAGLTVVFGQGLLELPGVIGVGLVYALVPGVLGLLAIHALLRSRKGVRPSLAAYASLSAVVGLLWFLPFVGVFAPTDGPNASAAIGGMAVYHAVSGAIGGLVFWLLTRKAGIS